jgi:hypothetical protein
MKRWPAWFPHPSAMLSAALLFLFAGVLGWVAQQVGRAAQSFALESPRLGAAIITFAILSPIGVIALAHRFLSGVVDGGKRGVGPSAVLSVWAGLFGWFAMFFASFMSLAIAFVFAPSEEGFRSWLLQMELILSDASPLASLRALFSVPGAAWLVVTAYLYQLGRLVEERWVKSAGA